MLGDDLADRVRADESNVEDKRDEVVVQDYWLQVEIKRNESPGGEIGEEAVERGDGVEVFGAAVLHHVEGTGRLISSGRIHKSSR